MTFLRAGEDRASSYIRRVITAVSLTSFAVYSIGLISASPAHAQSRSRKAYVRAETARLRSGPGTSYKSTALLDAGRKAKVVERKDGWVKLRLSTGTEGWVRSDLLKVSKKKTRDAAPAAPSTSGRKKQTAKAKKSNSSSSAPKKRVVAKKTAAPKPSPARTVKKVAAKPRPKPVVTRVVAAKPPVKVSTRKAVVSKPKTATRTARPNAGRTVVKLTAPEVIRAGVAPAPVGRLIPMRSTLPTADKPEAKPGNAAGGSAETERRTETQPTRSSGGEQQPPQSRAVPFDTEREAEIASAAAEAAASPRVQVAQNTPPQINRATTRGSRTSRGQSLVSRAMTLRGTRYRMGATGNGAFDCSGFTSYLFRKAGEPIPRTAAQQYKIGTPVSKGQLKAGDLVFFKNTYKRGISHVGVYVGNGKFIHASSRGGVRTDSLSGSYYQNHWAGARRPKLNQTK